MTDDPDPKLSILLSIKKMLNIDPSETAFDTDVIIHINSVLSTLWQLGIGLEDDHIEVEDNTTLWSDLLTTQKNLTYVKTYVYLKVRIVFDPLATGFVTSSFENQIKELEWRIVVGASSSPNVPATSTSTIPGPVQGKPSIWDLTGLEDFPSDAPVNAVGIDFITGQIYRKEA